MIVMTSLKILARVAATAAMVLLSSTMTTGIAGQSCGGVPAPAPAPVPEDCHIDFFDQLRNARCTNCDKFPRRPQGPKDESVISDPSDWNTPENNPFYYVPYAAYDVSIKSDVDCHVKIDREATEKEEGIVYSLIESSASDKIFDRNRRTEEGNTTTHGNLRRFLEGHGEDNKEGSGKLFLTHTSQCGVCSDLNSLASYLEFPAFERYISGCGAGVLPDILDANVFPFPTGLGDFNAAVRLGRKPVVPLEAFKQLEFCVGCVTKLVGDCLNLYTWNTIESLSKCGLECLKTSIPPGIPPNNPNYYLEEPLCLPGFTPPCPNYCEPASQVPFGCPVTINRDEPACYPQAYENGNALHLNLCLQCDECYMAPKFLEVGGRNRRNSGIVSGIGRPQDLISDIEVDYGVCYAETREPTRKPTSKPRSKPTSKPKKPTHKPTWATKKPAHKPTWATKKPTSKPA